MVKERSLAFGKAYGMELSLLLPSWYQYFPILCISMKPITMEAGTTSGSYLGHRLSLEQVDAELEEVDVDTMNPAQPIVGADKMRNPGVGGIIFLPLSTRGRRLLGKGPITHK